MADARLNQVRSLRQCSVPLATHAEQLTAAAKQRLCKHGVTALHPDFPVPAGTHQMSASLASVLFTFMSSAFLA